MIEDRSRLIFPDEFSKKLFSPEKRGTNDIFLVSEEISKRKLLNFYRINSQCLREIRDQNSIKEEIRRIHKKMFSSSIDLFRDSVYNLFKGVEIKIADLPITVTVAGNPNKFSYNNDSSNTIIRINEDAISSEFFGRYFESYTDLPKEHRPLFVVTAEHSYETLKRKLSQCPNSFQIKEVGEHQILNQYQIPNEGCLDIESFTYQYMEQAFSAVANTNDNIFIPYDSSEYSLIQDLSARLFRLRSVALSGSKFESIPYANDLHDQVNKLFELKLAGDNPAIILTFKALTNLWLLYCRERDRGLFDNSLAIACALGDDLVQAHVLRFINLIEKPNVFSEYCLKKATTIFLDRHCYDHANYCVNNLLLGKFFSDTDFAFRYTELINGSSEFINNLRGMSIIYNNAGVAHMVENKLYEAIELFNKGLNLPSLPLHRISIQVNKLIAERILGDNINKDNIINITDSALQTIDNRYEYQLINILLNLLNLRSSDNDVRGYILKKLESYSFLGENKIPSSDSLRNLLSYLGLISGSEYDLPGLRGRFSKQYGFVPIIHHTWL